MKEIIILIIICIILFIGFLATIIIGLVKKNKFIILISSSIFILLIAAASYTAYSFVKKSVNKVSEALKPRTGEEIYAALFDKYEYECLKIKNYQDQVVPKIDYAIWLHFETCPEELKRIVSQHTFELEKESTKGWNTSGPLAGENWFKPERLGDTVLVYTYKKDEYGNVQIIYSNLKQTEAYCEDILD